MKNSRRTRLEARGWRVGSAADFLELTPEEAAFVETKLALSESLRTRRTAQKISQTALAKRLKSSQSRIAKMEAADATVSIDLLLRGLFALGAKPRDVATAIAATTTCRSLSDPPREGSGWSGSSPKAGWRARRARFRRRVVSLAR